MTREEFVGKGLRRQVRTILLSGFAGGVLGLSTLSFYGRPQDQLTIIPIGLGVGLIVGVVVSTTQLVNHPEDLLTRTSPAAEPAFSVRGGLRSPSVFGPSWTMSF